MGTIDQLLNSIKIPRMIKVKQSFARPAIKDLEKLLRDKVGANIGYQSVKPGMKIAVAVGSRGITNLPQCVKILVEMLKDTGAIPFIVPAMGSHGGATAEGQKGILIGMGIREDYVKAPIRATMETVEVGRTGSGLPCVIDRYAHEADGIVIINRIKPHVAFRGPYESGLMKMITIGLGKQQGADFCHNLGFGGMARNIPDIANVVLAKENILFGVGLVENAYHETAVLEVLDKGEIPLREPSLLELSRELAPRLFFDRLDVLIIDEIGKDISGTGFDTNVVGRYHTPFISGGPSITKIAVLDLTSRSHGNANGLGIVDFTTQRVMDKFKAEHTYPNALTSTVPLTVKIPMVLKNDKQAIQACIKTCNISDRSKTRMARIKNTISLDEIEVCELLRDEAAACPNLEIVSEPYELDFSEDGNLNDIK